MVFVIITWLFAVFGPSNRFLGIENNIFKAESADSLGNPVAVPADGGECVVL